MTQLEKIRPYFLIVFLAGAALLTLEVFAPFLKPLALAAVFAVVLHRIFDRIVKVLHGWESTAALITVLIGVVMIIVPLSLVGVLVGNEARTLYTSLEGAGGGRTVVAQMILTANETYGGVVPGLSSLAQNASVNVDSYTKQVLEWITGNAGGIFSGVSNLLLSLFIFFIALYYLLRDGKRVRKILIEISPLSDRDDSRILDRLELAVNSVIKGNLAIALVQGVMSTVGLALFGVPSAILWGAVSAVAALIPGIGTGLVILPIVGYLLFIGATTNALGLLIWGMVGVGLIDNFLGPKLVGRGMNLHPLLVLLSVLGGLVYFGPAGIFLGPLTVSLLFALLSIYTDLSRTPL